MTESMRLLADASSYGSAYLASVDERPVFPTTDSLRGLSAFDERLPEAPTDAADTLRRLHTFGSPATTASAGGRYFGLVVGGALPVTVAANWLATAWDQVVFNEATSPVGVKLEQVAGAWLLDLLGLPADASVGFVTGASMANFTCLAAARALLLARQGHDVARDGVFGAPRLRIVASEQIHVTVIKALGLLGFGSAQIERVPTDAQGRMRIEAMPALDDTCIVLCQAGNVNSGASDPFDAICDRAAEAGAWVHVDGAFGLWAAASPLTAPQVHGLARCDSWVTDGHKWLNTPYDCGLAICRHPESVHRVMATQAVYLKTGGHAAPKDMVPEFSRRARGVEVWAALRTLGRHGVAALVERCCAHARRFAQGLESLGFEVLNDVVLNQVVATVGDDERVRRVVEHCQGSGECWFGPTVWRGRAALRISVSSWATTTSDVDRTLAAIATALEEAVPA